MANLPSHKNWCIYHLVQPYFFAHHHFHKRKIEVLRDNGFNAKILAVVPKLMYEQHKERYDLILKQGFAELIIVPNLYLISIYLFKFLIGKLLKKQYLLIHILRSKPWAVVFIKFLPILRSRLRYLQEFEGDTYSEYLYAKEYREKPRPPEKPSSFLNKLKANILLNLEKLQVKYADGLVLMSKEHEDIWESRLNKTLQTTVLPTVADPELVWFDEVARNEIRKRYQINDALVLTYTGNVISHWQRREEMCRFVAELHGRNSRIRFLALVRRDDLELMKQTIEKYEIESATILLSVEHREVYKYLSAADLALFLRHNHTMNKVVTSGKLGEYLSAGLPVLTTGNNANVLNEFIHENEAGYFIDDSLDLSDALIDYLHDIYNGKDNFSKRHNICNETRQKFGDTENPFNDYTQFIKSIIEN